MSVNAYVSKVTLIGESMPSGGRDIGNPVETSWRKSDDGHEGKISVIRSLCCSRKNALILDLIS
jgi:hypothetical protein